VSGADSYRALWRSIAVMALTAERGQDADAFARHQQAWLAGSDPDTVALNAGICPARYRETAAKLIPETPRNVYQVGRALGLDVA
jgi:hypothetical protein